MGINELRIGVTVISMILFIAIWVWAYSRRNAAAFEDAAQLPLQDDEEQIR